MYDHTSKLTHILLLRHGVLLLPWIIYCQECPQSKLSILCHRIKCTYVHLRLLLICIIATRKFLLLCGGSCRKLCSLRSAAKNLDLNSGRGDSENAVIVSKSPESRRDGKRTLRHRNVWITAFNACIDARPLGIR